MASCMRWTDGSNLDKKEYQDIYLFDPEKGETTQKFIADLKKYAESYQVEFNDLDKSTGKESTIIAVIVRSTTPRFQDDLDTALAICKGETFIRPDVIIYFQMKDIQDCSQTQKEAKSYKKYSKIEIIDMDFRENILTYPWLRLIPKIPTRSKLRKVNSSAYENLRALGKRGKSEISKDENELYIYDKDKSEESKTLIEELMKFMVKHLEIEETENPEDLPLAVISKSGLEDVEEKENFDRCGTIFISPCTEQKSSDESLERLKIIYENGKYFLPCDIGTKLLQFVQAFNKKRDTESVECENEEIKNVSQQDTEKEFTLSNWPKF